MSPGLKHLCIVEYGYPHPHGGGGAGTYVQLVGRELVRRGIQVSVVTGHCPSCPQQFSDQGVEVFRPIQKPYIHSYLGKIAGIRIFAQALRLLEYGWGVYRFIQQYQKSHPIDLIEFAEGGDYWHAWQSATPYVSQLHGSRYTFMKMSGRRVSSGDWFDRRLELRLIKRADWIFAPSQAIFDIVEAEAGRRFTKRTILPYPLDPVLLTFDSHGGNPDQKMIVLFAARNEVIKGGAILLEAVPIVQQSFPQVEFWMFGFHPAQTTVLPESVRIFPFLPKVELRTYYQQADICVIPSLWDNSPNTVYEAMAAGKPVVASRVGGISELVIEGETGKLVEPGKSQALANAMIELLRNKEECHRLGMNGRQRICEIADLEKNVDRRMEVYSRLVH
jgi:glycosyltransferase involved in cell wall biosynthesis